MAAVNEFLSKVEEESITKAETYAERNARREAEINGLENKTAFIQKGTKHFRLVRKH